MKDDLWNTKRIGSMLSEIDYIKDIVTISGGYAWHAMSLPHVEKKKYHDHKDVDVFVAPSLFGDLIGRLKARGYERQWTKYDGISKDFYRYTLYAQGESDDDNAKVMIDVFAREIPAIRVGDVMVVNPPDLIKLYEHSHSSKDCVAVQAAIKLLSKGISPVGRPELTEG